MSSLPPSSERSSDLIQEFVTEASKAYGPTSSDKLTPAPSYTLKGLGSAILIGLTWDKSKKLDKIYRECQSDPSILRWLSDKTKTDFFEKFIQHDVKVIFEKAVCCANSEGTKNQIAKIAVNVLLQHADSSKLPTLPHGYEKCFNKDIFGPNDLAIASVKLKEKLKQGSDEPNARVAIFGRPTQDPSGAIMFRCFLLDEDENCQVMPCKLEKSKVSKQWEITYTEPAKWDIIWPEKKPSLENAKPERRQTAAEEQRTVNLDEFIIQKKF